MALNLAKVERKPGSLPRHTFRRETTMPRQAVDLPDAEVNTRLRRPNVDDGEALASILGLTNTIGQKALRGIQNRRNAEDDAQASLDLSTGEKDEERFAKSFAYREAYQREGAKNAVTTISQEATEAASEVLNDPLATLEDVDEAIEAVFARHVMDERGELMDFGTPEAKTILANGLDEVKKTLMPQARKAIQLYENTRLVSTVFHNVQVEQARGAPIGTPVEVKAEEVPDVDPLAPVAGLRVEGNIALGSRPIVKNRDGSISTVRSISIGTDEGEVLIPTVSEDGKLLSETDAVALYKRTGRHLGIFDDARSATAYADRLHKEQAKMAANRDNRVLLGAPTGRPPHPGAVTSNMADHAKRGSIGVDIDGRIGDPIEAPAGGKVKVGRNKASGLFVSIDHGGGVVSTYAHLSSAAVKNGDVVRPGQKFASMGNSGNVSKRTGDGSHLHWRVKVAGKDVNPLAFRFPEGGEAVVVATGSEPELASSLPQQDQVRAGYPIETFMARLPPPVDKKWAKTWLLNKLFATAADTGDASILNGLEEATRADGAPSLDPDEILKVVQTRDTVRERSRIRAEQAENRLHKENADRVIQALLQGNEPDQSWLAAQADAGLLDARFALTIQEKMDAEADRRQARADRAARLTQEAADEAFDIEVLEMAVQRRSGNLRGSSYEEDLRRLRSGEFGDGLDAVRRFDMLQAAARAGRERAKDNPDVVVFAKRLEQFKPVEAGSGDFLRASRIGTALSADQYAGLVAHFEQQVAQGKSPEEAYDSAVKRYVPTGNRRQSLQQRRADLLRKQRSGS